MPVMDGTEMLGRLKSNPDLKSIPVIMLTAEAGRENVLRIAKMGVRDYLVKPFKEDQIVERVGRIVELKQRGGSVKGPETVRRCPQFVVYRRQGGDPRSDQSRPSGYQLEHRWPERRAHSRSS